MSKISELLEIIRDFLDSDDQSDTPQMRRVAAEYAALCTAFNQEAAQCRSLLEQGQSDEAHRRASDAKLCTRAQELSLSRRDYWVLLCDDYNWPKPPVLLDVKEFVATSALRETSPAALLSRWRRTARDGSHREKVELLRSILATSPAEAESWRRNLIHAEQGFLRELSAEAENAISAGDGAALELLYKELYSPELLTVPPAELLERIETALAPYQHRKRQTEARHLIETLRRAESAENLEILRNTLVNWEILADHPDFTPDPQDAALVNQARETLKRLDRLSEAHRKLDDWELQLRQALDENAPSSEIEPLYEALLRLDLPLDKRLIHRTEMRLDEGRFAEKRRHVRLCILLIGILILAVVAGGVWGFWFYREREYRAAMGELHALLENNASRAAVKLIETWRSQGNAIAQRSGIRALYERALTERDKALAEDANFAKQLDLAATQPTSEALITLKHLTERLPGRDETLLKRYREQTDRCIAAERRAKLNAEQAEEEEARTLLKRWDAMADEINSGKLPEESKLAELTDAAGRLSSRSVLKPELLARYTRLLTLKEQQTRALYKTTVRRREHLANLTRPASAREYLAALERIPSEAPALQEKYRKALPLLTLWSSILSAPCYQSEQFVSPGAFQELLEALPPIPATPADADLLRLGCKDYEKQIGAFLDRWEREIREDAELFELTFLDAAGREYRFYCRTRPEVERKMNGRAVKALLLQVELQPGQQPAALVLRVSTSGYSPLAPGLPGVILPSIFPEAQGFSAENDDYPRAAHTRFAAEAIRRLRSAGPERISQELFHLLNTLRTDRVQHPQLRLTTARRLLELQQRLTPLLRDALADQLYLLERIQAGKGWNWRIPGVATTDAAEITRQLEALPLDNLAMREQWMRKLYISSILRRLAPAGVFDGEKLRLFSPQTRLRELWYITGGNGHDFQITVLRPEELSSAMRCPPGTLLFQPEDDFPTEKLASEFQQQAENAGFSLDPWPATWPINRRGK